MPALFTGPQFVALSVLNTPLPGAKLTFTQTGSSTPQNVYQDLALTVPHANPVVANGAGVFDPIYLDPSLPNYRVLLTDSSNVTQPGYPIDDYPSNQNTGQTFRLKSAAPELIFEETDASAGNQKWRIRVNSEQLRISLLNDAESVATDLAIIDRTGTTADLINFLATALKNNSVDVATIATGSYSGAVTGMSSAINATVRYKIISNIVIVNIQSALGTSNATTMTITGAPVAIRPARVQLLPIGGAIDNGVNQLTDIAVEVATSGTFTLYRNGSSTGWTAANGKSPALTQDNTFHYFLD
jgi:hypothetical protein